MTATFELLSALHGKQITPVVATIDMTAKFDLWEDYTYWVDPDVRHNYYHDLSVLQQANVSMDIFLDDVVVNSKIFHNFETVSMHVTFDDATPGTHQLKIKITNLNKLPIYDRNNSFVSPMIGIESLKLQGIEILNLLEDPSNDDTDTVFSKDAELHVNLETPVYPWMIKNKEKILPEFFNLSMIDI
jgi:hypothetical protein